MCRRSGEITQTDSLCAGGPARPARGLRRITTHRRGSPQAASIFTSYPGKLNFLSICENFTYYYVRISLDITLQGSYQVYADFYASQYIILIARPRSEPCPNFEQPKGWLISLVFLGVFKLHLCHLFGKFMTNQMNWVNLHLFL